MPSLMFGILLLALNVALVLLAQYLDHVFFS